jgi:hypothetical protein
MTCLRTILPPTALAAVLAGATALSACSPAPQSPQAQADAETRAACRQRAEEVYRQQNRGDIYSPASSVNTPFSSNYVPGITTRGLSELFAHDKMVNDCVRNSGTGAGRSQAPAAQR